MQFRVFAAAQQLSETTVAPVAAATTKPGAADGALGPALTGVRRPLNRLHCSDVVEMDLTFSPDFKNCHLLIDAYEKIDTPLKLVLAGGSSQAVLSRSSFSVPISL